MCYISNKYQPLNNLAKHHYFYTRDFISLLHFKQKFTISIAEFFRNIDRNKFLVFSTVDEVCYISNKYQPPYNLEKRQYFHTIDFISLFYSEKKLALSIPNVLRTSTFTTFSLFLEVSDICNISSKCRLLNKSANKTFLHKAPYTFPLLQIKICALHCKTSEKHPFFTTFLLVFTMDEVCYISYK